MPANLTPQYMAAEKHYREAGTDHDRLQALKEMLRTIPKHKGTDKLQADIKRRMAALKEQVQKKGRGGKQQFSYSVKKEGLPQIALVGAPNVGKSQLIASLTNAHPEIAEYPFTTRIFLPGVIIYKNFHIQIVDLPPVSGEYMEYWVPELIRNADLAALVIDLAADDPLEQIEDTINVLKGNRIFLTNEMHDLDPYSAEYPLRTILIGNKSDNKNAPDNWEIISELYHDRFPMCPVSAKTGTNLNDLQQLFIDVLDIIRVYSKPPGKEPSKEKPFILKKGSTLEQFAVAVHHDFADQLKFARVWGASTFDGQHVNRGYLLEDEDIIELHM